MTDSLTWSPATSIGHSHEAYFGSTPGQSNVIVVYGLSAGGEKQWRVLFNDGSMRRPTIDRHPSLEAAKAHAKDCLAQPICERGFRSLANNAALIATRLCSPCDSSQDIAAAIAIAHEAYPNARLADIRRAMAVHFCGGSSRQAA
ncbi:MAG: hypothetical protein DI537_10595 [Stutzerimonas stutzeri]|nr:MAG: hypothetical protein DI537_10595 [Stutzerimonas stutzeri]